MIHAQQGHEAAGRSAVPAPRDQGSLEPSGPEAVVPAQQKRRPDAYDLYAEIFAIRTESRSV